MPRVLAVDHDEHVDRSSRVGGPPKSLTREAVRLAVRIAFFGGASLLCFVWRADETESGNRAVLLVLGTGLAILGLAMVWQSLLDIAWLRRQRR
jgi:hypothetical protein